MVVRDEGHAPHRETDACRVCGNASGNRTHRAREMFMGTRDPFVYVECGSCGTLQIRDVPDLAPYYPEDYYSFRPAPEAGQAHGLKRRLRKRLAAFARARAADHFVGRGGSVSRLFAERAARVVAGFPEYLKDAPVGLGLHRRARILDVGSGAGAFLSVLREFGFEDLTGVDPFVARGFEAGGVRVMKAELSDVEGEYDLVVANHSLEHVRDPRATLREVRRLLRPGRHAVVRTPVVGWAWREYGTDWVQLDAPRHLQLFTADTLARVADDEGFAVDAVRYDATGFLFWGSEQYARGIPLTDGRSYFVNPGASIFTPEQIADFEGRARELNARGEGDQAAFYLRRV